MFQRHKIKGCFFFQTLYQLFQLSGTHLFSLFSQMNPWIHQPLRFLNTYFDHFFLSNTSFCEWLIEKLMGTINRFELILTSLSRLAQGYIPDPSKLLYCAP